MPYFITKVVTVCKLRDDEALMPTLLPLDSRRRLVAGLTTVALGLFPQCCEEQDGRSFFLFRMLY